MADPERVETYNIFELCSIAKKLEENVFKPEGRNFPLHAKDVAGKFRYEKMHAVIGSAAADHILDLLENVCYTGLDMSETMIQDSDVPYTELTREQHNCLVQRKFVEPFDGGSIEGVVVVFPHPEQEKLRSRVITWTKQHNVAQKELLQSMQKMLISTGARLVEKIVEKMKQDMKTAGNKTLPFYACANDIAFWFGHLAIPPHLRRRFVYKDETGRLWQLCTVPTGAVLTPMLAQELLQYMCKGHTSIADCYIDNTLHVSADLAEIHDDIEGFEQTAKTLEVTMNKSDGIVRVLEYGGVNLDLRKTEHGKLGVSLTSKMQTRLKEVRNMVRRENTMPWVKWLSCLGKTLHAKSIVSLKLVRCTYYVLKFFRKHARAVRDIPVREALQQQVKIWDSVTPFWLEMLNELIRNEKVWIDLLEKQHHCWLFTDASLEGWGAVLFIHTAPYILVFGMKWRDTERFDTTGKERSINELETRAFVLAMKQFADHLKNKVVHGFIDNTTALCSLVKLKTRVFNIIHVLEECEAMYAELRADIRLEYVWTEANYADHPSRNFYGN
jgi:hypothetical protein